MLKVKTTLSELISQPAEKLCLIFSGKILKDHETLEHHSIRDGMAIHLVVRNIQRSGATGANAPGGRMGGAFGMTQQLMENPDVMRELMNTPLAQSILNNPDIIRSLIADKLGHLLNDPEIIRQTMEMVRNPNMFQEMMRNHDQAIRNLQGIPGGQAALQRLYQDVQEPLLNSAANTFASNPFASLVDNSSNTGKPLVS
ncbi:unnamed protein product [Gongylonema pulchrum]|uniref:Ubiquitin-like domain-containing protein n=1 Tax=Gongylonema pulchrum TaxID=637853 RepID=A0A183CXQ6_9BILA|nr:unnamed protein product [Gongylonema pulchrum]